MKRFLTILALLPAIALGGTPIGLKYDSQSGATTDIPSGLHHLNFPAGFELQVAGVPIGGTGFSGGTSGHVITASGATTLQDSGTALTSLAPVRVYDVKSYGALGDGSTDDTTAIAAAITAIPATGGILYFPATSNGYKTSGGFTLSKPIAVVGDGMVTTSNVTATWTVKPTNAFTQIRCTSATAVVFTVSSAGCSFRDIAFFNVAGSTPSTGSAIYVSNHGEMMRIQNVFVGGFYDNIDFAEGANWNIAGSFFYGPVRYGLRIRNTSNSDAGDQSIVNTSFYADNYNATSAIRYESGGGLKLTNVKINRGAGDKSFSNGVDCAFGSGVASGILLIANSSIENYTGHGVKVVASASGSFGKVQVSNSEFLNASSNTTGSGIYADGSAGTLTNFIITGCAFQGGGPAAVALTSVSFASLSNNQNIGFTARLTQSGCNSVLDLDAFFYGGQLLNYGFIVSNGTPPTTLPSNVDLWLRDTGASTSTWRGRLAAGGDNYAVLAGEYASQARIGAHNAALDAWADLYVQPGTSGATLHLGVAGGSPVSIEGPLTVPAGSITDSMASLLVKPAVAVVATSNLTLSGEQTIDGVTTSGSLVLATAQSTGSQNGPWVSAAGAWARPTWYANASTTQAPQFLTTFVRLGTTYQGSTWRMTTAAVTIGTTSTTWTQTPLAVTTTSLGTFSSATLASLLTDENGSGKAIFAAGTLAITSGKTLTASNTLTFAGTDSSTLNIGGGGTLGTGAYAAAFDPTAPGAIGGGTPAAGTFTTGVFGSTTSLLLGTAGSAVGNIGFRNATSGTITMAPPTGALGTVTLTLPLGGTLATLAGSEALTNKTVNGNTFTAGTYTLTGTAGKTLNFTNSLTLSGTDSTTMTFPGTSATIARTDAANTFTGHQTVEGVTSTGATGTGKFVFDGTPTLVTPILGVASATSLAMSGNLTVTSNVAYDIGTAASHHANAYANNGRFISLYLGQDLSSPSVNFFSPASGQARVADGAGTGGATFYFIPKTATQVSSDTNNYNPGGNSKYQRWSTDASRNLTGLVFTSAQVGGEEHIITNVGSQNIVLIHESASSTAANRFHNTTGADITLSADQQAYIWYDDTTARWRVSKMN